jgi:sterol desaturase/sphingolipid hydroxylase (fatty acid hydroxylase superfamily)
VNLIVLAIPVFFLLIAIEVVWARLAERDVYRVNDAVNDISCGILDQVADVFLKTFLFAGYVFVFERFRVFEIPGGAPWAWLACFVGVDFFYYWFHRWSHEVNAGWAAHIVHHQSEEYNLAVALRQGALQGSFSWVFYLPLAWLGFPPAVFLACSAVNTLYQFWIHTRSVGKLGPLEWVLNTPSHHRVHHGRNPKYIDRNHGAALIVWDRLFGTFQEEQEEPTYGITKPLASWNPLWANLHYWADLVGLARRASRPLDRLRVFWKRPGWRPDELGGFEPAPEVPADYRKFDPQAPVAIQVYVLAQFGLLNLATALYLNAAQALTGGGRAAIAVAVVLSCVALGSLLEQRRAAPAVELSRLALAAASAVWLLPTWIAVLVAAVAALSAACLVLLGRRFPRAVPDGRAPVAAPRTP